MKLAHFFFSTDSKFFICLQYFAIQQYFMTHSTFENKIRSHKDKQDIFDRKFLDADDKYASNYLQ